MSPALTAILLVLGQTLVAQAEPSPKVQYEQLLQEYSTVTGSFRAAETDDQRNRAVERTGDLPQKFVALADKFPDDPVALQSLRQAVQAVNAVDTLAQQAWELNRESFPPGAPAVTAAFVGSPNGHSSGGGGPSGMRPSRPCFAYWDKGLGRWELRTSRRSRIVLPA